MGSLAIVEVQPSWKVEGALLAIGIDASVGPFTKQGLDEALGLAVGLRRAWPGAQVAKLQLEAGIAKQVGAIASAVVCEDALDGDTLAGKPGTGTAQEGPTTGSGFVVEDFDVGQARVVIDGDMDKLPACPAAPSLAGIMGDAVPGLAEAAELLDIQVEQIARPTSLVAARWPWRLEGGLGTGKLPVK